MNAPALDMYTNLLNWLNFYETYLLRQPLQPDNYIFPGIGANGMSVDVVQKKITEMAMNAGIYGAEHYTMHCFHCGGAQYCFMFAPVGQCWTLARI